LFDFVSDAGVPELAPEPGAVLNIARRIDARLTDPLAKLPLGSFGGRGSVVADDVEMNLPFRNLVRGNMVGLATAQEMLAHCRANNVAVQELTPPDILSGAGGGPDLSNLALDLTQELTTATPLWFYILREAEMNDGRLGDLGGRIVAETFHRAMEASRMSILRDPTWRSDPGRHPGGFGMVDILMRAFKTTVGELRPLSPAAPRPKESGLGPRIIRNVVAKLVGGPKAQEALVTADVQVPDLGTTVQLTKRNPQGINPTILLLDLVITPGQKPSGQLITTKQATFGEKPAQQAYVAVEIAGAGEIARASF
jgi:hypothetical protein